MRYQTKKILVNMESIALTDIITNMFIFFFITFSLLYVPAVKEKAIKVDLPKAKSGIAKEDKGTVITLKKGDAEHVYFNGEFISLADLEKRVRSIASIKQDEPITVKCDKNVYVDNMVKIMDIVKVAGVNKINIAIDPVNEIQNNLPPQKS